MKLFPILCCATICVTPILSLADEPPATPVAEQAIPAPHSPDGFTILNNRVYFIRNGQMMPLQGEVVLRVSPDGTITAFDGKSFAIPHGMVLTLAASVGPLNLSNPVSSNQGAANASPTGENSAASPSAGSVLVAPDIGKVVIAPTGALENVPLFALPGAATTVQAAPILQPSNSPFTRFQKNSPNPNGAAVLQPSDSPFTRFHQNPVPANVENGPVAQPTESPFTRFQQHPNPAAQPGNAPNSGNAPVGAYK